MPFGLHEGHVLGDENSADALAEGMTIVACMDPRNEVQSRRGVAIDDLYVVVNVASPEAGDYAAREACDKRSSVLSTLASISGRKPAECSLDQTGLLSQVASATLDTV
jgi:hypothetical protein